ncbi:phage tail protein [Paenibacillus sp. y28]|uniref:phage tail protein n=1 Tax=Paenibacillus sp. y28 TaxID=3129110 RepID=UPI00301783A3
MEPFQFFSLNKPSDWKKGAAFNVRMSDDGLSLEQSRRYSLLLTNRFNPFEGLPEIGDIAAGSGGRLYLLDNLASVWSLDGESRHLERVISPHHGMFTAHAGLEAFGDMLLVADSSPEAEYPLGAYSASSGQAIWTRTSLDQGERLVPLAMAVNTEKEHLYVLCEPKQAQRSGSALVASGGPSFESPSEPLLLLELALSGEVLRETALPPEAGTAPTEAGLFHHLSRRFSLAAAAERVVVLDSLSQQLWLWQGQSFASLDKPLEAFPAERFGSAALDQAGRLYLGSGAHTASHNDDVRFIRMFAHDGQLLETLTAFRGCAAKLRFDRTGRLIVWDSEEQAANMLERRPRTRQLEETGRYQGFYFTRALDSTVSETQWHKIVVDAANSEESQLRISYYASDRREVLLDGMYVNLDDYVRRDDILLAEKLESLNHLWSEPVVNPQDALLFAAKGRYLWLRIEFWGSQSQTPLLRRMRVVFPRMSYLSYLPAVYQQDPASQSFLERYLSLYATFLENTDEQIAGLSRFLDADAAAAAGPYLKWLASWLGLAQEEHLNEAQLRRFIREAPYLFRLRGSREALERMIAIYTGEKPLIIEHFQVRSLLEKPEFAEVAKGLYGDHPYTFCVVVKSEHGATEKQRYILQNLIHEQKPAFTEGKLVVLQPRMYMDMHTYLEMNTVLSEPTLLYLDEGASMPFNTVLIDIEQENRMDLHTRLELDAELE